MVGPMGGQDISYMPMGTGPAPGFGDFRTFAGGSSRLSSPSISSYPPGGMLGRLNSTAGLAIRGIASSNMTQQPGHPQQTLSNSFNPLMRPNHQALLPNARPTMQPGDFNQISNPVAFNPPAAFSCAPSNPLMIQGADNHQQVPNKAAFGGPSSLGVINMDSFDPNNVQLPKFPSSSSLQLTDTLEDPRGNMQSQTGQIGNVFQNMNYGAADYNSTASTHFSGMNSLVSGASGMGPFAPNVDQSGANKPVMDSSFSDQMNSGAIPYVPQQPVMERQDGFIPNNIESLDDIMSAIMKRVCLISCLQMYEILFLCSFFLFHLYSQL